MCHVYSPLGNKLEILLSAYVYIALMTRSRSRGSKCYILIMWLSGYSRRKVIMLAKSVPTSIQI